MSTPLIFNGKNFEEDLNAFLKEMKTIDPEMVAILQNHLHHLQEFSSMDSQSSSGARQRFNAAVLTELEALAGGPL